MLEDTINSTEYTYMYNIFIVLEVVVAPPTIYLQYVQERVPQAIAVAGQNCYKCEKGAFTGEIRYIIRKLHIIWISVTFVLM